MAKLGQPIKKLAGLLEGTEATPVVVPSRLAPSAIYDVEYRTCVVAIAFEAFARPFGIGGQRRISAAKLKLLQFVVLRPWLLPAIREWSEGLAQGSLDLAYPVRIRRGFLSDTAHEDVVDLLVACGVFVRHGSHLLTGQKSGYLRETTKALTEAGLFQNERQVISELDDVKLTNNMLEGW
jgi:hypothetical protein